MVAVALDRRVQPAVGDRQLGDAVGNEAHDLGQEDELAQPVDEQKTGVVRLEIDLLRADDACSAVSLDELREGVEGGGKYAGLGCGLELELDFAHMLDELISQPLSPPGSSLLSRLRDIGGKPQHRSGSVPMW